MATKEPAKAYLFFNCDEEKSEKSMNIFYNKEVFRDTKAARKALWAKIQDEAEAGRVDVADAKAVKEAVMTGDPCDAGQHLHYGAIVAIDMH
jgi:hypothetical protein